MINKNMFDDVKDLELDEEIEGLDGCYNLLDDTPLSSDSPSEYIKENIFKLNLDNLAESFINRDRFQVGVNDVSYLCGAISALASVGITPNKAMDYIVDKEAADVAMKHNLEILNIQKETSVETARLNLTSNADSILKF